MARLRAGPSAKQRVTWTVGQYMPLKEIGKKGMWYQVQDLDGQTHWISKSLVTAKFQCVAVKSKIANLRKGPGKKFPATELATADRYTPFRQVQREGEWLLVQDEYKGTYWVADAQMWWPVSRVSLKF